MTAKVYVMDEADRLRGEVIRRLAADLNSELKACLDIAAPGWTLETLKGRLRSTKCGNGPNAIETFYYDDVPLLIVGAPRMAPDHGRGDYVVGYERRMERLVPCDQGERRA